METNKPTIFDKLFHDSAVGSLWERTSPEMHIAIVLGMAVVVHVLVKIIRHLSEWGINQSQSRKGHFGLAQQPKFITLTRLIVSAVTFVIYFLAIGFVLVRGLHVNLNTYLASASVIGFAISFGSQSLVQDVVTGVTLIFSNALDVGDIVEVSGIIGRVERIGLRFTKLINFYNQEVYVPNRNITLVSRFAHGGVLAYADVQMPPNIDTQQFVGKVTEVAKGTHAQFGGIILREPILESPAPTSPGGWNFLRVQFMIWPGQGSLIEVTFRQQMVNVLKKFEPGYADWMIPVTYRAAGTPQN